MKTTIFALALIASAFSLSAKEKTKFNYVMTKSDTVICEKLRFGFINAVCILPNGEKTKVPNQEIVKYYQRGRLFEKMPLIADNKPTGNMKFMELIRYSNGMRMYKYTTYNAKIGAPEIKLFIYKDDQYVLKVDENNKQCINDFFALKK